ncbi:FAD-dependent oxidoreductase [Cupriavidus sp. UME77]|uniref:FAD-dependent oxidoreductase n=1 Tax=Cupriavidus sp. UME77 TaxID=1862321 RepID=UPI0016035320|nr:FAD-dependent oxidoreductase [Cupriavidus sp. UME77]MBB1632485.1 2-polyprenyl-6-methoxyphenol hydroxylase [Cupriavidus sp. UME77]
MNKLGTERASQAPVLIVGAGPVGLGLALELAYRNIHSILVDQGDGVVRYSKMGHVSVRSMEHCRRWGVAEAVHNCGFPRDYPLNQVFCTSLNGQHIGTLEYPSIAQERTTHDVSPEHKQRCPQLWFDPILAKAAAARPEIVQRYRTKLRGFEQDGSGVRAQVEDLESGQIETITAEYMVGCDGSGSTVRQGLGIELEGDAVLSYSVGIYFTAPDLIKHHRMGPGSRYWLVGEEGTWGNLTVVDAKDIWRLTVIGGQQRVEAKDFDAHYWLQRCLGSKDIPYHIDAVLPWRRSRLLANRYGKGRVFLAGDASHVNAPNGGYGMNTGLGDAVDLGWKLQAVLEGWGAEQLLSAYESERRPVGQRNVDAAAVNFSLTRPKLSYAHVEEEGSRGEAARAMLRRDMLDGTRQEWETLGVHLGYRYEGSPLIWSDGTAAPPDDLSEYVPCARPGHRAPHIGLGDGRSILDLFGKAFVMLCLGDGAAPAGETALAGVQAAAAELKMPFEIQVVPDRAAHVLYERRFVLVRPDGHVAWRGDAIDIDPHALMRTVAGWEIEASVEGA